MPPSFKIEVDIAKAHNALEAGVLKLGEPSNFACPECHGVLLQVQEGTTGVRFRCHTGHAYAAESLMAEMNTAVEDALWNAFRSIQEGILLMRHFAAHAGKAHDERTAQRLSTLTEKAQRRADLIRRAVLEDTPGDSPRQ